MRGSRYVDPDELEEKRYKGIDEDKPKLNKEDVARVIKEVEEKFNKSGSKYLREIVCGIDGKVDVYAVIDAFKVTCPATQHALKKLLCAGLRGKGSVLQDLNEARDAITRAIQMEEQRNAK